MKAKKTELITGLDIGSVSVKYVQVLKTKQGTQLHRAALTPLSADMDVRQALEKMGLSSTGHVRSSLSGPSVIIRRVSMPLLSAGELQGAIRFEAENHIPFPIDECVLDYQVLNRDTAKKQMNVMLTAAKRDILDTRYRLLSELKMNTEIIDLDIFCLINAFETLNPNHGETQYGLLNIGHNMSWFVILSATDPVFVREIGCGGAHVTKALAEVKTVSETEAEDLKIKKPAGEEANLKSATQKGFEPLSEEIRRSIDYVENESKQEVKKIYVSGGGALAADTLETLSAQTGKTASFWDSAKNLTILPEADVAFVRDHSIELAIALGLAVRGFWGSQK